MKRIAKFTLRNFLLRHHGRIHRILLSCDIGMDSPSDEAEYDKWFNDVNKSFKVKMDLQHSNQELEKDFPELKDYLDKEIINWNLIIFDDNEEFFRAKKGEITLSVDLGN